MAISLVYGTGAPVIGAASLAGAYQGRQQRQQDDLALLHLQNQMQAQADQQDAQRRAQEQQVGMFRLQEAAQHELIDHQLAAHQQLELTKRDAGLQDFTRAHPEYADQAKRVGRALTAAEVSDLRENERHAGKDEAAQQRSAALDSYVNTHGDETDREYFRATGKLSPKLQKQAGGAGNAPDLKSTDEEIKALKEAMSEAGARKKWASYDPIKEKRDRDAQDPATRPTYQSPYRRSAERTENGKTILAVGDATYGREDDYWQAVRDMEAVQGRITEANNKRLKLTGAAPIQPAGAGASAPTSTPTPGAPMQTQAVTPEGAQTHMMNSAARLKVSPAAIAQMPAATMQEVALLKAQVVRAYSDPTAQRQAFYDAMIFNGRDPMKLPADAQQQQPAPGAVPGAGGMSISPFSGWK